MQQLGAILRRPRGSEHPKIGRLTDSGFGLVAEARLRRCSIMELLGASTRVQAKTLPRLGGGRCGPVGRVRGVHMEVSTTTDVTYRRSGRPERDHPGRDGPDADTARRAQPPLEDTPRGGPPAVYDRHAGPRRVRRRVACVAGPRRWIWHTTRRLLRSVGSMRTLREARI